MSSLSIVVLWINHVLYNSSLKLSELCTNADIIMSVSKINFKAEKEKQLLVYIYEWFS